MAVVKGAMPFGYCNLRDSHGMLCSRVRTGGVGQFGVGWCIRVGTIGLFPPYKLWAAALADWPPSDNAPAYFELLPRCAHPE
ncbi:MAG: hypothetical protein ACI802_000521 [Candidatus Paceibacteria bacterium]|jgi:hypothetical protein